MVMVMMMAMVTVVGSIELLYPSHHLAPHVTQMWRFKITQAMLFLWDRVLVGQNSFVVNICGDCSCGTEFLSSRPVLIALASSKNIYPLTFWGLELRRD